MLLEGSCHCRSVRFRLESRHPYPFNLCYCSICRKTAGGGGFAVNLGGDFTSLEVEGEDFITIYQARIGDESTGEMRESPARRHFCRLCGSALWVWDPRWPGLVHPHASAIDTPLPPAGGRTDAREKGGRRHEKAGREVAPAANGEQPMAKPASVEAEPDPTTSPMQVDPAVAGPYLRLDVGYGLTSDPSGDQSVGSLSNESVDDLFVVVGGIGYRHNRHFRGDLTVDFRPEADDVTATTAAGNTTNSGVDALSLMLNGYWDVTTIDRITPYVGAGLGYARLETGSQSTTGGVAAEAGATSDNFAWALTTGAALAITDKAAVDVNYRFTDLGEFEQAGTTRFDDLMVHEFRAGLRYRF